MRYLPVLLSLCAAAGAVERPPIVGVAHVALRTNDIAAARQFYGQLLGFADLTEVAKDACFKVNDHQYIEVYPNLTSDAQDRLIEIAFETTNAGQLRDYLASRGVKVPDALDHDASGLSFHLTDPDGHLVAPLPPFAADVDAVVAMYEAMPRVRVFDAKAVNLQRTGQLGTYPSSLGHEATHVGVGAAMRPEDVLAPVSNMTRIGVPLTSAVPVVCGDWGVVHLISMTE